MKTVKELCMMFFVMGFLMFTSCNDAEIYITSPNTDDICISNCSNSVFKLDIIQDGNVKASYTGFAEKNSVKFNVINSNEIDFRREVILTLEVLKKNDQENSPSNQECQFKVGKKYQTVNIMLLNPVESLEIYEIDIYKFYQVN